MNEARIARYYRGARTTHLERLRDMVPGDFFYLKPMYDFALPPLSADLRVAQVKFRQVLRMVWKNEYDVLEIVEPYAPSALPQTLALSAVSRIARMRRTERRTSLVSYAIENADLPRKFARQFHMPVRMMRVVFRVLVRYGFLSLGRIAFGTEDAQNNYRALLGERTFSSSKAPKVSLVWGLPSARTLSGDTQSGRNRAVFVGAFDDRKGLNQLLVAWPLVKHALPDAELIVMGKGPKEHEVRKSASAFDGVTLIVDPPRDKIWTQLEQSSALILMSQPAPGWKEQIGLPIVEGLSMGLEIVASTETGIAGWLVENGHRVLAPNCGPEELATTITEVLRGARSKAAVQSALPARDGRLQADQWLMSR